MREQVDKVPSIDEAVVHRHRRNANHIGFAPIGNDARGREPVKNRAAIVQGLQTQLTAPLCRIARRDDTDIGIRIFLLDEPFKITREQFGFGTQSVHAGFFKNFEGGA